MKHLKWESTSLIGVIEILKKTQSDGNASEAIHATYTLFALSTLILLDSEDETPPVLLTIAMKY